MFGKLLSESHTGNAIVSVDGWCEDNYIISYFCKSLTGYMKNYIKKLNGIKRGKKYRECVKCGKLIEQTSNHRKYCNSCWKEIHKEQDRQYQKKKYNSRLLENPEKH